MTRDEIMALQGRDLDAVVADWVMLWTQWIEKGVLYWKTDTKELIVMRDWKPSENIADARMAVEKMNEIGFSLFLSVYHDDRPKAFFTKGLGYKNHEVIADTPELAICRAALLAVLT
jgi:hypothetical protein